MDERRRIRISVASIFFTFFIDTLVWSIVFPIFAPYFLDPTNALFSAEVSVPTRVTILGLFLTAFSLGQFLGAPLLGEFADRHGRKKALMISIFLTFIGLALSAWSMQENHLYLLFAGRLITGFFSGSTTICLVSLADLKKERKTHYFGYMSSLGAFSFIIGGFLGGKLSDESINPLFFPALPLWISTGLSLINFFLILWGFEETYQVKKKLKFDFSRLLVNFREILKTKKLKEAYLIYFLFLFAWAILLQFTPVLMIRNFDFTNSNIADLALFMGICWAIGAGILNNILSTHFSSLKILEGCLIVFTILLAIIVFPTHIYATLSVIASCVLIAGLAWPHCTSMISNIAPSEEQGKTFGMIQSVQSAAAGFAPFLGGLTSHLFLGFYFWLGTFATLLASVLYFYLKRNMRSL